MKRLVALATMVTLLLAGSVSAAGHLTAGSSVDGTGGVREIRWEEFTRYDDARVWGINAWNALGRVRIAPDDAMSITDLRFQDYSDCSPYALGGRWVDGWTIDLIEFNTCKMPGHAFGQRAFGTHELGHALGIADHPENKVCCAWRDQSIMYFRPADTAFNTPQAHDRADYFARWP